jgi:hypothetical protein
MPRSSRPNSPQEQTGSASRPAVRISSAERLPAAHCLIR